MAIAGKGLKAIYAEMEAVLLPSESSPVFRWWHVEGLLAQGSQLIQRAVDERSEYFALLNQRDAIEDQLKRERNETTATGSRATLGSGRTAPLAAKKELDMRVLFQINQQRIHDMANQAYRKAQNEANDAWVQASYVDVGLNETLKTQAQYTFTGATSDLGYNEILYKQEIARTDGRKESIDRQFFNQRLLNLENRLNLDYSAALDRLIPASKGLAVIFGYQKSLPEALVNPRNDDGWNAFDALIDWTRRANAWLAAFLENDQQFTKSISLAKTEGFKKKEMRDGKWHIRFYLPQETFTHDFVRLRGISAYVRVRNASDSTWEARISVPTMGVGALTVPTVVKGRELDQVDFPPVSLGRIAQRNSPVPAEIAGSITVGNASPISRNAQDTWRVELSNTVKDDGALANLVDFEVELHLSGVPRRMTW